MSFCFTLIIIVAVCLFYYQSVIFPVLVAWEKAKLFDIVLRLDELKKKNVISPKGYSAFRVLVKGTAKIFSELYEDRGKETDEYETEETSAVTNDNITPLINSKNIEAKTLFLEYIKVLSSIGKDVKYPWVLYCLPLIFSEYLRIKLFKFISTTENWKMFFPAFDINKSTHQLVPTSM